MLPLRRIQRDGRRVCQPLSGCRRGMAPRQSRASCDPGRAWQVDTCFGSTAASEKSINNNNNNSIEYLGVLHEVYHIDQWGKREVLRDLLQVARQVIMGRGMLFQVFDAGTAKRFLVVESLDLGMISLHVSVAES